ncbi:flagellar basal body-associated FliL family protein [Marinobacter zhanjiangensis]|uniref:Flagellar protein FliL n=1 Tax=Marinobacter zhanjiangensis TaxID=578215 RepID=A0ABQ3AR92_9GAMM|nr:flagellar basal body-associated FliL family protein [Marinobacter zhanjiangensis]GGY63664.1 flagellar basal body-associated protein FliL [Marinobacter zhanjiangensis]
MAENNEVAAAPKKKGRLKTILLLIVVLVLAIGLSIAGTLWFLGQGDDSTADGDTEAAAEEVFVPASYLVMDKPLVTTISNPGRQRYIQVYLALESSQEAALQAARKHLPLLRNALISELGTSEFTALQTVEGRQALPERLLATVNTTLEAEGEPAVDRVLLRNFVVQ